MKRSLMLLLVVVVVAAALAGGYWWGARTSQGGSQQMAGSAPVSSADQGAPKRRILYYRNPMGLPDTSPVQKKDQMGMDYIPVYEGEEPDAGGSTVKISTDRVQKLGVRTEAAGLRELVRTVQAVATIQANERQLHTVSSRFEGWIQKLYVNSTGQLVKPGESLLEVYSPDLVTAQHEYLIAWKGVESVQGASPEIEASMRTLVDSALQRLRNWDISESELQRLQQEKTVRQSITLRAQAGGVVMEKRAVAGMRFMPGEMLYQIADLTSVWVLADVFEQDLGLVRQGQSAKIRIDAYPDKTFFGTVTFIYPTVTAETRTAKVRLELSNPAGLLKPAMYARVEFASGKGRGKVLAVPDSAVLDTGTRQLVLVRRGEGAFEPRPVRLGMRADGYIEVLEGIKAGEDVVVSANFLIDAESNLKAALSSFGTPGETDRKPVAVQGTGTAPGQMHKGRGTVNAINPQAGTINLSHSPIPSLNWPAMTMDFQVTEKSLLKDIKPGQSVEIDIVQRGASEFVVTRIAPLAAQPGPLAPAGAQDHKGH